MTRGDLTSLESVKTYLGIDPEEVKSDPRITKLISSESMRFVSLARNPIFRASYSEVRDGDGSRVLAPAHAWSTYPLVSVTSLKVDGADVAARPAYGSDGYFLMNNAVLLSGYTFTAATDVGNVEVVYVAGYDAAPADVEQAVNDMVALKLHGAERIGLMSQSVAGETVAFQTLTLPEAVESVIKAYRPTVIA